MQKFKIGQVVNICINRPDCKINCKGIFFGYNLCLFSYPYLVTFDDVGINQINNNSEKIFQKDHRFLIAESEISEIPE